MRICGVDPGLKVTGYGVVDSLNGTNAVIDAGTIRSSSNAELSCRLREIFDGLCEVLDEHDVDMLAVENVYSHYNHPQTAVLMGHARAMALLAATQRCKPVSSFAATQIKRALTGNGRASKSQMQQAIKMRLGLSACPEPHDVADALAIALCAFDHTRPSHGTHTKLPDVGARAT